MPSQRTTTATGSRPASPADPHRKHPSWLRVFLPVVVLLMWFAGAGFGGPLFGKLTEVQSNSNSDFLPVSSESVKVQEFQKKFADSDAVPAVVVLENTEGITPSDLEYANKLVASLSGVEGVDGQSSPPIPSEDGQAIQIIVPVTSGGEKLKEGVAGIREKAEDHPASLKVYVTGPGGLLSDFTKAFGAIDGILLVVALGAVLLILLVVYRSPVLPLAVLATSLFALSTAIIAVYYLAKEGAITLNGQSQGILFILAIGAATDYSLLLVARYREELREHASPVDAMKVAWKASFEPIVASGGTVVIGLMCLLFSDLNSNKGLGPVGALGIVFSVLSALTFLPAVLVLLGRAAFWPRKPEFGSEHKQVVGEGATGIWARTARLIHTRTRVVWASTAALLLVAAAFSIGFKADGVEQTKVLLTQTESVEGQDVLAKHFPAGSGSPVLVIGSADKAEALREKVAQNKTVESVVVTKDSPNPAAPGPVKVVEGKAQLQATLKAVGDSPEAEQAVRDLRAAVKTVDPDALVGGTTASTLDTTDTAISDKNKIIPIVLVAILLVLILLLRSVLAPVLLILTVILSYFATLGVADILFYRILDMPGADPSVPLFGFVFLVALGIDYNIFLMTRVREESIRRGTRPGILHGLGVTGGVITSAGVVLAATFAALGVIPILFMVQIAFIVAFGVLLDTVIVRSLLVPALAHDIGAKIWWPSKLGRQEGPLTEASTPKETAR